MRCRCSEIDKLRFSLRIDQRTDDKEKARKENDSLLLRSYSTHGRVQSSADDRPGSPESGSSDDAPAGSERREGLCPGKIQSHESTGHEEAPRNFSVHSDQPSAQGGSRGYLGKYLKRLLAKSEHENGPSGQELLLGLGLGLGFTSHQRKKLESRQVIDEESSRDLSEDELSCSCGSLFSKPSRFPNQVVVLEHGLTRARVANQNRGMESVESQSH